MITAAVAENPALRSKDAVAAPASVLIIIALLAVTVAIITIARTRQAAVYKSFAYLGSVPTMTARVTLKMVHARCHSHNGAGHRRRGWGVYDPNGVGAPNRYHPKLASFRGGGRACARSPRKTCHPNLGRQWVRRGNSSLMATRMPHIVGSLGRFARPDRSGSPANTRFERTGGRPFCR